MNGVHDMGGMQGFGPIDPDPNEPMFHAPWERDVLALTLAMGARGLWNLDESRFSRESLPPADYLSIGYYRIWLAALQRLLLKHQLIESDELAQHAESGYVGKSNPSLPKPILTADKVPAVLAAGAPVNRPAPQAAQFQLGQVVHVRNINPVGHTRLPRYIRGRCGIVHSIHGCHIFPDTHAARAGEQPQWVCNIRFESTELWGDVSSNYVHVDCWEPYLETISG